MQMPVDAVIIRQLEGNIRHEQPRKWELLAHFIVLFSFALTLVFSCLDEILSCNSTSNQEIKKVLVALVFFHAAIVLGSLLGGLGFLAYPLWLDETT
jgi:hypothetical protein